MATGRSDEREVLQQHDPLAMGILTDAQVQEFEREADELLSRLRLGHDTAVAERVKRIQAALENHYRLVEADRLPPDPLESLEWEAKLEELAALSAIEYDRRREEAAKELRIRVTTLDGEVTKCRRQDGSVDDRGGAAVLFKQFDPWPEPVEGGELLADLIGAIDRFVVLGRHAAVAIALWTLHTHAHDAAWISPILAIVSPEKRCGKTTMLALLQRLVPCALPAANITSAALFRATEKWQPTLLVDEADSFLKDNDELRGVLNSGHNRATAQVIRTAGEDHEPRAFRTWAPKAIALIGSLPGTLEDRSIVIAMRRRRAGEAIDPLRGDRDYGLKDLARRCARWVADHSAALTDADPNLPLAIGDRAADNWRPLVAIADQLGEGARAREAVQALSANEDEGSAGTLLLGDVRDVFAAQGVDRLSSRSLVDALIDLSDRPWSEWRRGKSLTTNGLARLLKPFEIRPKTVRIDDLTTAKGYDVGWFDDALSRYLPDNPDPTVTPSQVNENTGLAADATVTRPDDVTDGKAEILNRNAERYGVTVEEPELSEEGVL